MCTWYSLCKIGIRRFRGKQKRHPAVNKKVLRIEGNLFPHNEFESNNILVVTIIHASAEKIRFCFAISLRYLREHSMRFYSGLSSSCMSPDR